MDRLDLFRRVPKDLTEGSIHGSLLSIVAICFAAYLGLMNCAEYIAPLRKSEMLLETDQSRKLNINIDIKFPALPCGLLSLDAHDVMGSHELDTRGQLRKITLDYLGKEIGEEVVEDHKSTESGFHGLSRHNWNLEHVGDSEKLKTALINEEGCRLKGSLEVNKVPGNIHISTHSASFLLSGSNFIFGDGFGVFGGFSTRSETTTTGGKVDSKEGNKTGGKAAALSESEKRELLKRKRFLNMSHEVLHFSFGDDSDIQSVAKNFKGSGILSPLDGLRQKVDTKEYSPDDYGQFPFRSRESDDKKKEDGDKKKQEHVPKATIFEYYCNIVPTTYEGTRGPVRHVYQFTVNSNAIVNTHMPMQTLAIIGGLFTCVGLIETILHSGIQTVQRKFEMGKLG